MDHDEYNLQDKLALIYHAFTKMKKWDHKEDAFLSPKSKSIYKMNSVCAYISEYTLDPLEQ